jgi:regulator of protease activity HflC (stomatin/prohibitin superfamily)
MQGSDAMAPRERYGASRDVIASDLSADLSAEAQRAKAEAQRAKAEAKQSRAPQRLDCFGALRLAMTALGSQKKLPQQPRRRVRILLRQEMPGINR